TYSAERDSFPRFSREASGVSRTRCSVKPPTLSALVAQRCAASCCAAPGTHPMSRRDLHVLEIAGLVVDADLRRRDPTRELAGLGNGRHQRGDELAVVRRRQPLVLVFRPSGLVDDSAVRLRKDILELTDMAVESDMR